MLVTLETALQNQSQNRADLVAEILRNSPPRLKDAQRQMKDGTFCEEPFRTRYRLDNIALFRNDTIINPANQKIVIFDQLTKSTDIEDAYATTNDKFLGEQSRKSIMVGAALGGLGSIFISLMVQLNKTGYRAPEGAITKISKWALIGATIIGAGAALISWKDTHRKIFDLTQPAPF